MNARSPRKAPTLDDRTFQDLVDDAKLKIRARCPGWTDHNVSDPGVMLIELYAYMTEMLLYRLNQTPERNYLSFLKLIGLTPEPARPATGDVTFTLDASLGAGESIKITAGTEIGTSPEAHEERVVYYTGEDYLLETPRPIAFLTAGAGKDWDGDVSDDFVNDRTVPLWSSDGNGPAAVARFAIGFDNNLSRHQIRVSLTTDNGGTSPQQVSVLSWQVYRIPDSSVGGSGAWEDLPVLTETGSKPTPLRETILQLPSGCAPESFHGRAGVTWIQGVPAHDDAADKWLARIKVESRGITVPVSQGRPTADSHEVMGQSDATPGQSFALRSGPVLEVKDPKKFVEVETTPGRGDWEFWPVVNDFTDADSNQGTNNQPQKQCELDLREGMVRFGPRVEGKQFGAIPLKGARVRVGRYRIGGGTPGNLRKGSELSLLTTIPKLSGKVKTYTELEGGREAESNERLILEAPRRVRLLNRARAVTADDFEARVREMPGVGAVHCVRQGDDSPGEDPAIKRTNFEPGKIKLLVVPSLRRLDLADRTLREFTREFIDRRNEKQEAKDVVDLEKIEMVLPTAVRNELMKKLNEIRTLTATLVIESPICVWLRVSVEVQTRPGVKEEKVRQDLELALYQYFHPLFGGDDQLGWAFRERIVSPEMVYRVTGRIDGIELVEKAELKVCYKRMDTVKTPPKEVWVVEGRKSIKLGRHSVLCSSWHEVTVKTEPARP